MKGHRRYAPVGMLLLCGVFLSAASCNEEEWVAQDQGEYQVAQQAIYYGTRSPTITDLTSGEQMAIGFLADQDGEMFCTATLIDRDTAVTARHCVEATINVEDMRFGMGDPSRPEALIEVHSAPYNETLDVALLFLKEDAVSLVPEAEPIPFNRVSPSDSLIGNQVEAAGFGQTHDGSEGLYFAVLELTGIENDHLVVNGHGERGICFGDSGGPLFITTTTGEPVIGGVESYGDSSCVDQDFETRLDRAVDWIDDQSATFDPNSPPQTGPQGDGWDPWCIPVGGEEEGEELGTPLGFGQQVKACPPGSISLCSASPTTRVPHVGLVLLFAGIMIWALRQRCFAVCRSKRHRE